MFGLVKRKESYATVVCKAKKLEGRAAHVLKVEGLDIAAVFKAADEFEPCSKVTVGTIYQKPGSLLADHRPEEQGYTASYDKVTKSIGIGLRQGLMRQTLVVVTREPLAFAEAAALSLDQEAPAAPPSDMVS